MVLPLSKTPYCSSFTRVSNTGYDHVIKNPKPKAISHQTSCNLSLKYCTKSNGLPSLWVHNRRRSFGLKHGSPTSPSFIRASSQVGATVGSDPIPNKLSTFTKAFLRFLRLHAVYANIVSSVCVAARTWLVENPNLLNWSLPLNASIGFFSLFCLHVYYIGINQIYDVDIDKVNKPKLPIAAGDLSIESAWVLVIAFAVNGLSIVLLKGGPILICIYSLALFVATAYSAPPFRLKRFALGRMFTLFMMRGIFLNIGLHYATRAAIGLTFEWTAPFVFIITSTILFTIAISFIKDLIDMEGDSKFEIATLVLKIGARSTTFFCWGLLMVNYVVGVLAAIYMPQAFRRSVMIPAHIFLASCLIFQVWVLDKANYTKEASSKFFRFIWNLLYTEFAIYPFI